MKIDEMIDELLVREGGFVNDPDDPGGATKYGITIYTLRAYRGKASVADVKALTKAEAKEIYLKNYYIKPNIGQLPLALQPAIFDMYVNAGDRAVKIFQSELNILNSVIGAYPEDLTVDGSIGPLTLTALSAVYSYLRKFGYSNDQIDYALRNAYGDLRREFYYSLADNRPASRKYARTKTGGKGGWIKRAEEFMNNEYIFTQAQHEQRTLKWA